VCTEGGSLAVARLISGGEHRILRCARPPFYVTRSSSGGRKASMARVSVGVDIKQLVVHLWTVCENAASFLVMWTVGRKASAP